MSKTNGSEHAFPHMHIDGGSVRLEGGFSKREYLAAMAMHLLVSEPTADRRPSEQVAFIAVQYADALIAALNKDKT